MLRAVCAMPLWIKEERVNETLLQQYSEPIGNAGNTQSSTFNLVTAVGNNDTLQHSIADCGIILESNFRKTFGTLVSEDEYKHWREAHDTRNNKNTDDNQLR